MQSLLKYHKKPRIRFYKFEGVLNQPEKFIRGALYDAGFQLAMF